MGPVEAMVWQWIEYTIHAFAFLGNQRGHACDLERCPHGPMFFWQCLNGECTITPQPWALLMILCILFGMATVVLRKCRRY